MSDDQPPRILIYAPRERNWLEKACLALVGAAVLVLGFFFLTVALVAGALLALVIIARWWWLTRKLRKAARDDEIIEGQYNVVEGARRDPHDRSRSD